MCLRELPEISETFERYKDAGVAVFAVGTGGVERLEDVRQEKGLLAPLPIATDSWREALGVVAFPETLFIDAQGRVAERLKGGQDAAYFAARVDALLAEATPGSAPIAKGTAIEPASAQAQSSGGHSLVARVVYRLQQVFTRK